MHGKQKIKDNFIKKKETIENKLESIQTDKRPDRVGMLEHDNNPMFADAQALLFEAEEDKQVHQETQ